MDRFIYTPGAIQALADHYYDDHTDVLAVDAYADFDRALIWLDQQAPELTTLLRRLMCGYYEADLAHSYHLRPRTLARLLDQTFLLLAQYLNEDYPLEIPHLAGLQQHDRPFVPPATRIDPLVIALSSLSMTFFITS